MLVISQEKELRLHRCCFTGHRTEKLHEPENVIINALHKEILSAINAGFVTFISGMARGVDIWAAELVISLKAEGYPLHLICACPYEGVEKKWKAEWQNRYKAIIAEADLVLYICPAYSHACFQIRNEWMGDHSARVIAAYNGKSGGTRNTIVYAERHGIEVSNILLLF